MTHPRKPRNRTRTPKATPGLAPRRIAADAVDGVLFRGRPFDATLESEESAAIMGAMEPRDRALTTMICQTTLRQLGLLRAVLARKLQKPLPPRSGRTQAIILVAMAQILFLDIPAHAAVDMAVRDAMRDRNARHFKALVNAVLRALAADPEAAIAGLDPRSCNTPEWLVRRWRAAFGEDAAAAILGAHALVPPVDLTVKSDARAWADRLGGTAIAPTTVRISRTGRIDELPGYREGQWWVQDYAASLPARLLGDVAGKDVADLAAAPGRQDGATGARGRARHRRRPFGPAPGTARREHAAPAP